MTFAPHRLEGMPLSYLLAGCPALVANLWDVTDRDIDKFRCGLTSNPRMPVEHCMAFTVQLTPCPDVALPCLTAGWGVARASGGRMSAAAW